MYILSVYIYVLLSVCIFYTERGVYVYIECIYVLLSICTYILHREGCVCICGCGPQ